METKVGQSIKEGGVAKDGRKTKKALMYSAIAVIIIAAALVLYSFSVPVVVAGDTVSVYYTGSFTNGTVFGTNVGGTPLNFTVGANQVIPGFEDAVIGMKVGESKTVSVPPDEGYGYVNQSRIISVPISDFGNNTPTVGEIVTTATGSQGEITVINATNAIVNFNSPLAGKTLVFSIKVVAIGK